MILVFEIQNDKSELVDLDCRILFALSVTCFIIVEDILHINHLCHERMWPLIVYCHIL